MIAQTDTIISSAFSIGFGIEYSLAVNCANRFDSAKPEFFQRQPSWAIAILKIRKNKNYSWPSWQVVKIYLSISGVNTVAFFVANCSASVLANPSSKRQIASGRHQISKGIQINPSFAANAFVFGVTVSRCMTKSHTRCGTSPISKSASETSLGKAKGQSNNQE